MFSLRTISLYAAIACATISSAVPLDLPKLPLSGDVVPNPPRELTGLTGLTSGLTNVIPGPLSGSKRSTGAGGLLDSVKVDSLLPAVQPPVPRADATKSVPDVFSTASDKMGPICDKMRAAIVGEVKIKVVVDLLVEIVEVLHVAIAALKVVVEAKLSLAVLLTFRGVVLTVAELAVIVYALIKIIVVVLYDVVLVVGITNNTVYTLVLTISGLLCELLKIAFTLVVGLDVAVIALAQPLLVQITYLKLDALLVILKLKA